MGYYTYYSMQAHHIKTREEYEAIIQALKDNGLYAFDNNGGIFDESDYDDAGEAYFNAYDECKWYDHTYDMMKISKMFPEVTFCLSGDGEERDDMWREYFHNGEVEECHAQIIFPSPTRIEWEE